MDAKSEFEILETSFIELRCQLRHLKGKLAVFCLDDHPNSLNRSITALDQTAHSLYQHLTKTLVELDQYEFDKQNFEMQEDCWAKIQRLCERTL